MTNHFIEVLNNLLNFGVREDEVLSGQDRIKRVKLFKDNFRIEDYLGFFNDLEKFILNEEISCEEKEIVVILLINVLSSSCQLEDNISLLPPTIVSLYNSYITFLKINILFEGISRYGVVYSEELKSIIFTYISFCENPSNEFFIHYVFSKIRRFNERLQIYLDSKDIDDTKSNHNFIDIDLLLLLGKTFGDLNASRNY